MSHEHKRIMNIKETYKISRSIHEEDFLLKFLEEHLPSKEIAYAHYFANGLESAERVKKIVKRNIYPQGISTIDPNKFTLLDFASGFGMVNRHFKNVMPDVGAEACDIHPKAIEFHKNEIGIPCHLSSEYAEDLDIENTYDVVIAISFFSHLPKESWIAWLDQLFQLVNEGGMLIFTCHGPSSNLAKDHHFIRKGINFLFYPESEQKDLNEALYGTSCAHPNYVIDIISNLQDAHLSEYKQGAWWGGTQDFYVLTKATPTEDIVIREFEERPKSNRRGEFKAPTFRKK